MCTHTCTHRPTHTPLRGWWLTEVNPCHGERELEEGGMEGGEEKQETALSFTESGGVIRGVV